MADDLNLDDLTLRELRKLGQERQTRLYKQAKAGDPACIPGLLELITDAAIEILRLESLVDERPVVDIVDDTFMFKKLLSLAKGKAVKLDARRVANSYRRKRRKKL